MSDVLPGEPPGRRSRPTVPRETVVFLTLLVIGLLAGGVTAAVDRTGREPSDGAAPTTVPATTTVPAATTSPSSTTPGTTAPPGPTTTASTPTTAPPSPTTRPATTAPPTTPPVAFPRCTPEQVVVTVGTNKAVYVVGEAVRASVVVRDISPDPCYLPNEAVTWRDASGAALCCLQLPDPCGDACPPNFFPGEVRVFTPCWNQRTTNGAPVGTGRYAASYRGVQSSFEVVTPDPEAPPPPRC